MGTAGCGKTSVAEEMQKLLQCEYIEGDQLHPKANVDKMSRGKSGQWSLLTQCWLEQLGEPLNDDDRYPWLHVIVNVLEEKAKALQKQDVSSTKKVIILTCSSLRKAYRDLLRQVPQANATITFVYLKGSPELLLERITGRKGHFMAAKMLESQLDTLEEPPSQENVIVADIRKDPPTLAKWIVDEAHSRTILS